MHDEDREPDHAAGYDEDTDGQQPPLLEVPQSRAVIEQAKGILMAAHRYNANAAFAHLVTMSQRDNVKVSEIARGIVEGATGDD